MKERASGLRWCSARFSMWVHRRLPVPLARIALGLWVALPDITLHGRDWRGIQHRLSGLMIENAPHAAHSLAERYASRPRRARVALGLARALAASGYAAWAIPVLRSMVDLYPTSAQMRAELASALRRAAKDPLSGDRFSLASLNRREGLLREAQEQIDRALRLDPDDVGPQLERAAILLDAGRTLEGVQLIGEVHALHASAATALALGSAMHRSEIADFEAAVTAYREVLEHQPNNRTVIQRLNSVSLRTGSWSGWDALVASQSRSHANAARAKVLSEFSSLFSGSEIVSPVDLTRELLSLLRENVDVDPALLHSISARLQAMGEFALGFEVRRALAERVRRSPSSRLPHTAPFQRWAAASVCLGDADAVVDRFAPYPWSRPAMDARATLNAILVDAEFSGGIIDRLGTVKDVGARASYARSERRMQELLEGSRVAIVGPGVASGDFGAEIDNHDVVVRTRFSQAFVDANRASSGSRTDIAYYSGTDVHVLLADAMPAAEAGDLQLAVARPISYAALARTAFAAPWLRFYPRDYALIMNGGPLGITRILHDVLRFAPRRVSLYNVDYYTGAETFAHGYRTGPDAEASPGSIVMDIFRAHDLLTDFSIHRNLFARGLLHGPPAVARITGMTPLEYTTALERAWKGY